MQQRQNVIGLANALLMATLWLIAPEEARAQEAASAYPSRTVKLVVPYAPGGFPDTVSRIVAQRLSDRLGQSFVIENKPGAAGVVAGDYVAKSAPDGYTLLMTDVQTWGITPAITKSMPFDPLKDFAPISMLGTVSNYFTINGSLPASSFNEFVALVKAKPGYYNYGSAGVGSIHHLVMEVIMAKTGMKMVHVPYRGSSQIVPALLTGEVAACSSLSMSVLASHWQKDALKVLAVTAAKRSAMAPDVKTFAELGIEGVEFTGSLGALAPTGTPATIIAKLSQELAKAVHHPESVQRFETISVEPVGSTPAEFAAWIGSDFDQYAKAAQSVGLERK
jgi:tripartite-type tricarboxylate transporter receptor subunit TctC